MASAFTTILIPVDFSINTDVALKKALELAVPGLTTIHLHHVEEGPGAFYHKSLRLQESTGPEAAGSPEQKLDELKFALSGELPDVQVCCWASRGSNVQQSILAKARKLMPDLIIIGKRSTHNWLPFLNTVNPTELAEHTGACVLTVKPGSMHNSIRTVVLPVADQVPLHKMEVIGILCKKLRLKIHLVSFVKGDSVPQDFSAGPLLRVYQWLKNIVHCPVEYAVLHGHSKPRAFLAYAEKIGADTLLLHPETETRIGWPNRHISDLLPADSKMQVLTVQRPIESLT